MLFRFLTLFTFSLTSMSMTVIDVRTEAEWNTGHLEGALHIEWQEYSKISSDIKKDEEIFYIAEVVIGQEKQLRFF